jgi:hypothetical protein
MSSALVGFRPRPKPPFTGTNPAGGVGTVAPGGGGLMTGAGVLLVVVLDVFMIVVSLFESLLVTMDSV